MGGGGDDRTFRFSFSNEGVTKLRERVNEKLKEFMGDYTDDTLVEYVIVLLKNGRSKDEARNELNVFLGDDSDSFVTWLWDHLGSNLNQYVQSRESHSDGVAKIKTPTGEQAGRIVSSQLEPEIEKEKLTRTSRTHHNREWKALVRDADEHPPPRSSVAEEGSDHKIGHGKRSLSPLPSVDKKRSRPEERHQTKREGVSQNIAAPRRLLQFAVRDAVGTSKQSNLTAEPSLKRLRSVVSTSAVDPSSEERPKRIKSAARVPSAMATAIKAVADAAKDVSKIRSSGNVFDRLGRSAGVSQLQLAEDGENGVFDDVMEDARPTFHRQSGYGGNSMLHSDTGVASDSASDHEGYDDMTSMDPGTSDVSQIGISGGRKSEDSQVGQHCIVINADEIARNPWKGQSQPASALNASSKMVNISSNMKTWRPPQYENVGKPLEIDGPKSIPRNLAMIPNFGVRLMKDNSNTIAGGDGNANPCIDAEKESQKMQPPTPGIYSTGPPTEDADSRTIFVNNVHFAATKDSLSRHFNKFGEVLKVIILTDAATGQPKGSAYIEFMRKEAAEHALSLDGTSFMSRILKVVWKSSAPPEAATVMTWPRMGRGSPFAVSRFGWSPFPRGVPSMYRARPPIKPGARSFQWKRDAQSAINEVTGQAPVNGVTSTTPRSLTYIRTEAKTNGSSGSA